MPVKYAGHIGYWQFVRREADTFVVRATVLETVMTGRWDASAERLIALRSFSYDTATAYEYTLQELGGVWKVVRFRGWLEYMRGEGVHPGSA